MEFSQTVSWFFGIRVSKPLHKIWGLQHFSMLQKSTLPLSEESALTIMPAAYCFVPEAASALLKSINHCVVATTILLPMTLPLPLLHLYYRSLSSAASAMLLTLPLHCNSATERSNWNHPKTEQVFSGCTLVLKTLTAGNYCIFPLMHCIAVALHCATLICTALHSCALRCYYYVVFALVWHYYLLHCRLHHSLALTEDSSILLLQIWAPVAS